MDEHVLSPRGILGGSTISHSRRGATSTLGPLSEKHEGAAPASRDPSCPPVSPLPCPPTSRPSSCLHNPSLASLYPFTSPFLCLLTTPVLPTLMPCLSISHPSTYPSTPFSSLILSSCLAFPLSSRPVFPSYPPTCLPVSCLALLLRLLRLPHPLLPQPQPLAFPCLPTLPPSLCTPTCLSLISPYHFCLLF